LIYFETDFFLLFFYYYLIKKPACDAAVSFFRFFTSTIHSMERTLVLWGQTSTWYRVDRHKRNMAVLTWSEKNFRKYGELCDIEPGFYACAKG
jgi:hypothetical protein